MLAHSLTLAGEHGRARSLLAELPRLSGGDSPADPPAHDSEVLAFVALVLGWLGDPADGAEVVEHGVTVARATGATERLPMLLSVGAELRRRAGDWDAAEALGVECGQIEKARPELPPQAYGHTALAWIAAARGDGPAVIGHAGAVSQLFTGIDAALARWLTEGPLALLELSVGDDAAVVDRLNRLLSVTTARGLGDPSVLPFHGDLVEAALRRGRRDLAEQAVEALRPAVEPPRPALLAVRDRCLALLAADTGAAGEAEAHFLEALRRHALGTERFEAARTRLCHGEWLRRIRRTTDARTSLIAARETFAALRAGPWTERADQALRLSGGRRRPATTGGPDHIRLTEQETQVAALVGGGASNREAAAALFISAKTVEYHLGNIYAKVGLRSRTQLAAWLRSPAGSAGDA